MGRPIELTVTNIDAVTSTSCNILEVSVSTEKTASEVVVAAVTDDVGGGGAEGVKPERKAMYQYYQKNGI